MMPQSITMGKNDPIAKYVAVLSFSQKQAMTNPKTLIDAYACDQT